MRLRVWAALAVVATLLVVLLGAYVTATGAGVSCPDWPKCNGQYFPPFPSPKNTDGSDRFAQGQILSEYLHRVVVALTTLCTIGVAAKIFRKHRTNPTLLTLGVSALGLLFAQVIMGAATVKLGNAPWTVVAHQALAFAFFGVLVAIFVLAPRRAPTPAAATAPVDAPAPAPHAHASPMQVLGDYIALTKPRVLLLLLVSAVTSMLIAVGPSINPWTVVATVLGGAMSSGAGSAFNQWWEKDLDAMMSRTATRPVAAGRIPDSHVLAFSASLALGSFMVLSVFVNLLAASLALAGAVFYVVVYTLWLKRTTAQNIVVGGAAGSFPALVGWAAATGTVQWPALVLGFIVFLWTPPHFWSFALVYKQDYARAHVPMLPVVRGDEETKQQIFLYSIALFVCATSLWLFGVVSDTWFLFSLGLSALFVLFAFLTLRDPTPKSAYRLFRFSIAYLGLLFLSIAVDRILSTPHHLL